MIEPKLRIVGGYRRVDDERSAVALSEFLNGGSRKRPVVVVTIPASRTEPWIDVDAIAREAGNLADVYLMPTGDVSWKFSDRMADGTQVFGGAGRVYPIGHEWATDLTKSPLRFAWSEQDGEKATRQLVSDVFRAAARGLARALPTRPLREVDGVVKLLVAGRALVSIGNAMAAVAQELTVEDVPIERLMTVGQRVSGRYDADTNRLDVTTSLRPADDALTGYVLGDVVLARVVSVRADTAELMLFPKTTTPAITVAVSLADVTLNPLDDLRQLMTVGEVVAARVTATSPRWALVLNDVDDDEPIRSAPSVLTGGPPWLLEEPVGIAEAAPPLAPPAPVRPSSFPGPSVEESEPVEPAPSRPAPMRPSPALFDRNRPRQAAPPASLTPPSGAQPSEGTKSLLVKIDGLTSEVNRHKREANELRTQLLDASDEREQLRYLLEQAERRANRSEHELKVARARLRKVGNSKASAERAREPQFADHEQGFRYLVLTRWATRTLPSEQAQRPLLNYAIGPEFLGSLAELQGITEAKVADVVFEIVTGLAPQIAGRQVHQLRTGAGGNDPFRVREDGARAYRASLQVDTPSARRIHYWILPGGQIELAQVDTHDQFGV